MSITITDPALLAQLANATGVVELCDPSGRVICTVVRPGERSPRVKSPISDEEFDEARKQTGGRPLADILRDLEQRHGGR